jgi:hypothetical protein
LKMPKSDDRQAEGAIKQSAIFLADIFAEATEIKKLSAHILPMSEGPARDIAVAWNTPEMPASRHACMHRVPECRL